MATYYPDSVRKPRSDDPSSRLASHLLSVVGIGVVIVGAVIVGLLAPTAVAGATPVSGASGTPVAACGVASGPSTPSGVADRRVHVGTVERTYRVHVPSGYRGTARTPLLLAFHGRAEKSTTLEKYTRMSRLPAIVVYPDGLRGAGGASAWQGAPYASPAADDIAFTRAILREVRARYCVDDDRTYAVGRSNGAGFVSMLSCVMSGDFAAFGTVSGAFYDSGERRCAQPKPLSLINFHGTADDVIHYAGGVRHGGRYQGVDAWLDRRVTANRCFPLPIDTAVTPAVERQDWPICLSVGHEIVNYRIDGGTHRWPGSAGNRSGGGRAGGGRSGGISDTVDATSMIWQFFQAHPRLVR